ncbi:Mu-like prophage major head subunit gpT family protein [Comamonas terrigena]|uniref:Mu-like prophage major head subunit gpT family protein n=1 Tax=Comamonas terrigena TaxID=32013 RepID=UPI00289F2769|nr:Mu-like prophage major head subunit gpT family protein [Comamonas terrigena]
MPFNPSLNAQLDSQTTLTFVEDMLGEHKDVLGAVIIEDELTNGTWSPVLLSPAGKARVFDGSKVINPITGGGVIVEGTRYEYTTGINKDAVNENSVYQRGKSTGILLAKEAKAHWNRTPVEVVLRNPVNPMTGHRLFGNQAIYAVNENGSAVLENGQPVVLKTACNVIAGEDTDLDNYIPGKESWGIFARGVVVRASGEKYSTTYLGSESEHTFKTGQLVAGWEAKMYIGGGLWYTGVYSDKTFDADSFQEALDLMASFVDAIDAPFDAEPVLLFVRKGSKAAAAAKRLMKTQVLTGGETNVYHDMLKVVEY